MAQRSDTQRAQQILNYNFHDQNLIQEALQAPGVGIVVNGTVLRDGNKTLALLGQSVLEMSIHLTGYRLGNARGELSLEKESRVAPARLAQLTRQSNLDMCVALNPSQASSTVPPVLLSDTMKAVLGAVWIDCDLNMRVWAVVARSLG